MTTPNPMELARELAGVRSGDAGILAQALIDAEAALRIPAERTCEATEWAEMPEDGVERCLDPEYIEMSEVPAGAALERCDPCNARATLARLNGEAP